LVNGEITGRRQDDEKTAFVFRGLALGDLAVAALAYQRALQMGKGSQIDGDGVTIAKRRRKQAKNKPEISPRVSQA
jgi:hypothetical protein